jgi:nitrite reductase (NADH) small subunit
MGDQEKPAGEVVAAARGTRAKSSPAPGGAWRTVCSVEDIPRAGARRVARPQGLPIALFRSAEGRIFALLDRCPHRGGPLSQGIVFGDAVACPLHNWTIDLDNGCARGPDSGCTPRFRVRVENGMVALDADELATRALDEPAPVAPGNRIAVAPR